MCCQSAKERNAKSSVVENFKNSKNMKRQIRQGVFETNSSSTHAVAIISDDDDGKVMGDQLEIQQCFHDLNIRK